MIIAGGHDKPPGVASGWAGFQGWWASVSVGQGVWFRRTRARTRVQAVAIAFGLTARWRIDGGGGVRRALRATLGGDAATPERKASIAHRA